MCRRGRDVRIGSAASNRQALRPSVHEITETLRPTTMGCLWSTDSPGIEPGPPRLELGVLPLHHGSSPEVFESGRPGSNGPLRSGAPLLFPMSYVRTSRTGCGRRRAGDAMVDTPGWDRTSVLCPRKAALASAELRAFERASGRSRTRTSAVQRARAAVDTTEAWFRGADGDGGGRTRSSSVQARRSSRRTSSPWAVGR
jgi:hypothetical protein